MNVIKKVLDMQKDVKITLKIAMPQPQAIAGKHINYLSGITTYQKKFSLLQLHDPGYDSVLEFAFGPHGARPGDMLIPFMQDRTRSRQWEAMMCLRVMPTPDQYYPGPHAASGISISASTGLISDKKRNHIPVVLVDTSTGQNCEEVPPPKPVF